MPIHMHRKTIRSQLPVYLVCLLSACSLQQQPEAMVPAEHEKPIARPFPADSLYALLAGELAGQRGREDVALLNYFQQAQKTRDPGVARQATLLARQLQVPGLALEAAELWAATDPTNAEPVYIACQYAIALRQPDKAMRYSNQLLSMHSDTLFTPLAASLQGADDATRARLEQQMRDLYSQHEGNPDLLLGIAILLEQQSRHAESLVLIRKAKSLDADYLPARLYEVEVLHRSGEHAKALNRMSGIVADHAQNDRLRMQYAQMLLSQQDLVDARQQLDKLATHKPMEPSLLLARGLVNFRLDDRKQSKDFFEQLLYLKKHTDTAHYYLGELAAADNKPADAIEHFRRVESGDELLAACARGLDLMIGQNQRLEGQQWLAEQRERHPTLADKLYSLESDVLLKNDDLPRAKAALDEAIRHNPGNPTLYYDRSLVYERLGNVTAAEQDLRQVLALKPNNPDALNALGYILADKTDRLDEAHGLIARALAQKPDDPAIIDSMGWVLFRQGKLDEAVLRLQRAIELYPSDEVAAHLGEALWVRGDHKAARKAWEQGLKQNPDSETIRATRQRLDKGTP